MNQYFKAVRLDRTSHYDGKTRWRVGAIVRPDSVNPSATRLKCGHGIHCSSTLLKAVRYQRGPSRYYVVEPEAIVNEDYTKARCTAVKVIRELSKDEQDRLAGFKLYEVNHLINPLLHKAKPITYADLALKQWSNVCANVRKIVTDSVRDSGPDDSVMESVWYSVASALWDSVADDVTGAVMNSVIESVKPRVRCSVIESVWAYTGGLFPNITSWRHAEHLGPNPWRPLLKLWYAGYVPSFDGKTWRLHAGKDAKIVYEMDG